MARASPFAKSSTTALTSAFVVLSCFALRRAHPPAIPSCKRPQRPLGSAAVIAVPATIGEATTRLHSSALKLALLAIAQLLVRSSRSTSYRWPVIGRSPVIWAEGSSLSQGRALTARPAGTRLLPIEVFVDINREPYAAAS